MARLPDLPIGVWLSDQASRFADATAGYFPALEFEDGAKQAESIIPPDYPLPGGPDQWEAAEQQRIEDELRRAQQEEEERKRQAEQADLARREQELRAQQVAEEQRSQDQGQQATGWAQRLGIPTPDEVFSGFSNLAQRPTDNLSSTGSFERQAPEPTLEPTPEPPATPQSPVDQFTSWAQGLTAPLFREHTYADSVREAQDRPPEPARAAPSTTGILDTLGSTAETLGNVATGAGRALYEGGKAAVEEWQQPQALGQTGLPPDVLGPMTRGAGVVRKAGEAAVDSALRLASGGLGASAEPYHYGTIPETVPAQVPGLGGRTIPFVGGQDVDFSQQDVVAGVGGQVLDPINYLGVPAAVKAGRLAPELIRSLPGVGETELLFQGGRGLVRRASEALSRPSRGGRAPAVADEAAEVRGRFVGSQAPEQPGWEPTYYEPSVPDFEATAEPLYHGTSRPFDRFDPEARTNMQTKRQGFFFTEDPEVAERFGREGGRRTEVISWGTVDEAASNNRPLGDLDEVIDRDEGLTLSGLQAAARKRLDQGYEVFAVHPETGNWQRLTDPAQLIGDDLESGVTVYQPGHAPRTIQTNVYGRTLDLRRVDTWPPDLLERLRTSDDRWDQQLYDVWQQSGRYGRTTMDGSMAYRPLANSPTLERYAAERGVGKIRTKDAMESGGESIYVPDPRYIGYGQDPYAAVHGARPPQGEIRQVGSGVVPERGRRIPVGAANAAQGAVFGAASENLQAQQEGRDVDYGEQAKRALIGGVLGYGAGRFGPAGARALGQEARRLGSGVTPNPPGTPPGVGRAADLAGTHADAEKIGVAYDRVQSGAYRRQPDETDIKQIITAADKARGKVTDRHAELAAVVRHAESLLPPGQKLTSKERIDLLALNYPGNEDVSRAVMERVIEPEMRQLSPADYKELNIVMTQLDNADMDAAVRRTTQNQGLGVEVEGKPGVETVRMDAEARLERKRAQAQHRLARKEHGAAIKERDELLAIIRATGEGPTHGVETDYQAFQRGFRGFGPPRRMETPRSAEAEARFAKSLERVEKANAGIATAEARVAKSAERSRLRRIDQQTRRAATRAEEVGTSRQYSGGATPQEVENIEAALKERVGPERYEKIVAARGALYDFRDMMRERLLESEVWDQDLHDVLTKNFPHYSPVRILKYLDESHLDNAVQQGGRSFSVADNGVKALTKQGTTAERMTPVEAIYQMGFQSEKLAQRNAIMRRLAEWSENPQMHAIVQPLSGETDAPPGFERVSAFVDGQKQSLAVADDLMPALNLGQPGALGAAGAVLRAAKTPLEMGATRGNPAFIMMNTLNDYLWTMTRYALESKGGPKGVGGLVNPWERMKDFKDVTQGYLTAFRELPKNAKPVVGMAVGATTEALHDWEDHEDDPYYWYKVVAAGGVGAALARTRLGKLSKDEAAMIQRFRESGASIGGARGRFSGTKDLAREMLGEYPILRTVEDAPGMKKLIQWDQYRRLGDILGLAWTRPLGALGSAAELGPRYATFRRGERAAGDSLGQRMQAAKQAAEAAGQKFTSADADVVRQQYVTTRADPEIVRAAREITADFDKGGRLIKQGNNLLPFLNAATQATASGADLIWKNKTKSAVVSTALVGGLISLDAYNRSVSPEDYANVSAVTKNTGAFILSDKEPEAGGKRGLVYIPLRGWLGALVPVTRAAMDQVYGTDTRRWDQIATDTARATVGNLSPVNADMSVIANLATPPGSTMLQLMANYDYFRGQPIVSRSMAGLPTSEQFDTRTSLMARQLGRLDLPGVGQGSPMKWDWFFRNISPGPSAAFMGAVDTALRKSGYDLPEVEKDVPTGARDIPLAGGVLGRVLRTVGSEQENRAYELASDIMARHSNTMVDYVKSSSAYQAATPDRRTQMLRSAEQAMIEQANTLAGVDQFKQPKNLGLPPRFEGVQAGSRLEGEVGSALAKSRKNQSARERFLVQQYGRRETRAWKKLHTAQDLESQQLRSAVRTLVRE